MNWFEIIKENRLSTETATFTTVDNENKPESDDSRCREALKKKIAYLKFFENYITNISSISDYEVTTLYVGKGVGRRLEGQNLPNSYDHAIEALDSIPEEACCVFLELLQKCIQGGNSFLNTYWNKPHDEKKVRDMIKNNEASFYENREITIEGKKWDITFRLSGKGSSVRKYDVKLWIRLLPFENFDDEEESPFIEFDILYPSQYGIYQQNYDLENEENSRWDLLRHVVKALELG